LDCNNFRDGLERCLKLVEGSVESSTEAVELYRHCLDLAYTGGALALSRIIYRFKDHIIVKDLPAQLQNHADKVWDLVQLLIQANAPELDLDVRSSSKTLMQALESLHKSRNDADFQILIGEDAFPTHSFILSARWPYMSRILQSGMKEAQTKRLLLPPSGQDGAITPLILQVALELCYTGIVSLETSEKLSPATCLHILSVKDLYFDGETFEGLLEFADTEVSGQMDLNHCTKLLKVSSELGIDSIHSKCLKFIAKNFDLIKARPDLVADMMDLPHHIYKLIILELLGANTS
jgi:hypothetical protein